MDNQEQIIEGNKTIAVFEGRKYIITKCEFCGEDVNEKPICSGDKEGHKRTHALGGRIVKLQYHSSWDWLYEPYKKFFSLKDFDTITDGKYHNRDPMFAERLNDLQNAWGSLDINHAANQLCEAINWYNNQNK